MKVKVKLSNLLRQFSELQGEPEVFEVTGSNPWNVCGSWWSGIPR